uniref:Putative insecticidal protein n=1 Tax=Bacillus thuringiensis TaxID=1428 RepID=A0A7M1VLM5_BACTU|nr:putative insecticidal protein [Bacillus thuringiensis]
MSNYGSLLIEFAPKEKTYTVHTQLFGRDVDLLSDRENLIGEIQPGHYTISLPTFIRNNRRYIPINPSPSFDIIADGTTMLVIDYDDVPVAEATDTDGDGISDELETGGYIINNYTPVPAYNPDGTPVDPNKTIYRSDPANISTTRDPYNDYMKTTGLNMDATVEDHAERQPLVAAHPTIQIELVDVLVTPKQTISDKNGNKISSSQSETIGSSLTTTVTQGWNIGGKISGKITLKPPFGGAPGFEVSGGYNQSKAEATQTSNSKTQGQVEEFNWETAITQDTVQAASIKFNLKITNVGTASIKQPRPTFNVKLGGKVIATVQYDQVPIAPDFILQPGQSSPIVNVPSTDTRESIYLTLDQLKAFELGTPIEIEITSISGIYMTFSNGSWVDGASWATHLSQIEEYTATINFENKNGVVKRYRVAANRSFSTDWQPNVDIAEALVLTVGATEDANGVYIGGSPVNERWAFYISNANNPNRYQEVLDELAQLDTATEGLLQVKLKAKDYVTVIEPSDNPVPEVTFAQYSPDYKAVTASVTTGSYPIKEVKAEVKFNNVVQLVSLTYVPETGFWSNSTPFTAEADGSYAAKVIAYDQKIDVNGNPTPGTGELVISQPAHFLGAFAYYPSNSEEVKSTLFALDSASSNYVLPSVGHSQVDVLSLETIGFSSNNSFFTAAQQTIFTGTNDKRRVDGQVKLKEWNSSTVYTKDFTGPEVYDNDLDNHYGGREMGTIWLERAGNYSRYNVPVNYFTLGGYDDWAYQNDARSSYDGTLPDISWDYQSFIAAFSGKKESRPLPGGHLQISLGDHGGRYGAVFMDGGESNRYYDPNTNPRIPEDLYASNVWIDYVSIYRYNGDITKSPVFIEMWGEGGSGDYTWYLPLYFAPGVSTVDIDSKFQSIHIYSMHVYNLKTGNQWVLGAKNGDTRMSPSVSKMAFLSNTPNVGTNIAWSINPGNPGEDVATSSGQKVQARRLGYFKEFNGTSGSKLQIFGTKQSQSFTPGGSTYSMGVTDVQKTPTAFLCEVISEGCDPYFNVTINNVPSYLGKADMRLLTDPYQTYEAPNSSEVIMVPSINGAPNLSIAASNFTKGKLTINVIGYFNEAIGSFYKKLDAPIKIETNGQTTLTPELNYKPKAYIIKANIQGLYTKDAILRINNQDTIRLGISDYNREADYETISYGNQFNINRYTGVGVYVPTPGSEYHLPWEIGGLDRSGYITNKQVEIIGYFA